MISISLKDNGDVVGDNAVMFDGKPAVIKNDPPDLGDPVFTKTIELSAFADPNNPNNLVNWIIINGQWFGRAGAIKKD